ncbi:MAG: bifunctional demethylmenaquinone methyltransferase/2-methoxy-6-polyprenyl-1,4-benzoquinol methylase UbiE [Phycisphaerae bacterium]|nr:bifunctional demethylmenaquinone methyltransferase/2-methoxy-6-polyprenyl-1,4-benzoquinol methylase UbiE [Phycisphaerae bacterium]NUQ49917.1 bifunctional demethylmenaquinone methyltransferase/2-methoxy-6-polyprenyl-1,4-benzoquinol methylase UbiE [Phycisphaerae bacterium]
MPPAPTIDEPPLWDEARLRDPHHQPDKAHRVRRMFDHIAPTYERVNTLTSAGRDRHWRRRAVALCAASRADVVLDVACGTGDLARAFAAVVGRVVGLDFSSDMLRLARARPAPATAWVRADALKLPFADASFTIVGCAFGVRNFQDLGDGLREFHRVLRPAGRAVILEFTMPRGRLIGGLYRFYLMNILPRVAGWLSGDRHGAYRYLSRSVASFENEDGMEESLRSAGFVSVERHSLTCGVVCVYVARKAGSQPGHETRT